MQFKINSIAHFAESPCKIPCGQNLPNPLKKMQIVSNDKRLCGVNVSIVQFPFKNTAAHPKYAPETVEFVPIKMRFFR